MTEKRQLTPVEIAEKEEYDSLFSTAKAEIESMTRSESPDGMGIKRMSAQFDYDSEEFTFTWDDDLHSFGIEFSRDTGKLIGQTRYNFHLENGFVDLTGEVGENYGNESLPDLIYAPMELPMGALEDVRQAPLSVDLPMLRNLVKFINNPIKNRGMIETLSKLPGEEKHIK